MRFECAACLLLPALCTRLTRAQPFAVYTTCFAAGIYANIKALELTSVGVVIAARSCLPLLVALLEWAFMGRSLPSSHSCGALMGVLCCAGVYVWLDSKLAIKSAHGVFWLFLWWCLLAFQMAYGKHITSHVDLGEHERVFYTNALSLPPTLLLFVLMGEHSLLAGANGGGAGAVLIRPPAAAAWLSLSWLIGVGISYTGWRLKELVTATTFTLVGVINKMATLALSALAFPGSTSLHGGLALTLCILFGFAYRDAPMRPGQGGDREGGIVSIGGLGGPLVGLAGGGGSTGMLGLIGGRSESGTGGVLKRSGSVPGIRTSGEREAPRARLKGDEEEGGGVREVPASPSKASKPLERMMSGRG